MSDEHYLNDVPWVEAGAVANSDQTMRANRRVSRQHNGILVLTDDAGREITIGAGSGLLALDAADNIVHDIPNAPVLRGDSYLGHIVWFDTTAVIDSHSADAAFGTRYVTCLARSATNVKGVLLRLKGDIERQSPTTASTGMSIYMDVRPKTGYVGGLVAGQWLFARPARFVFNPGAITKDELMGSGIVLCPIDPSDMQIDVYYSATDFNGSGGSLVKTFEITQLGVLV